MSTELALSRTTRLINEALFDSAAEESAIAAGLLATTVRLVADKPNMSSRSGQAALVCAFQLIARMGIGIELIVPEVPLLAEIPPLAAPTLRAGLLNLGHDLIPGATVRNEAEHADATFVFGDSPCEDPDAIYVTANGLRCRLARDRARAGLRITGNAPIGALAAGAAAAAIALETAVPHIADATGACCSARPRPSPGPPVDIDMAELFPSPSERPMSLGDIDAISAGAITNAFIFTLLWLPETTAEMRVLDNDYGELSNVNRNTQQRASDEGKPKITILESSSTSTLKIAGVNKRFNKDTRNELLPLAKRIVVGVDDIPARWWIQEEWPANLYVAATSNHEAIVTNHHPGEPCAGCAHPHPLELAEGEFIPTISFVSFWAGLLQACALLTDTTKPERATRRTVYPFGLGEKQWSRTAVLPAGAHCAISCPSSRPSADMPGYATHARDR
jgi:hypothetical protein